MQCKSTYGDSYSYRGQDVQITVASYIEDDDDDLDENT